MQFALEFAVNNNIKYLQNDRLIFNQSEIWISNITCLVLSKVINKFATLIIIHNFSLLKFILLTYSINPNWLASINKLLLDTQHVENNKIKATRIWIAHVSFFCIFVSLNATLFHAPLKTTIKNYRLNALSGGNFCTNPTHRTSSENWDVFTALSIFSPSIRTGKVREKRKTAHFRRRCTAV